MYETIYKYLRLFPNGEFAKSFGQKLRYKNIFAASSKTSSDTLLTVTLEADMCRVSSIFFTDCSVMCSITKLS